MKSPGDFTIFWEYDQPFYYAVGFSYYFLYYSHQNYHGEKRFTYKTTDKMHQHAERLALAILLPEEEIKNVSNRHIASILNIPLNYVRLRHKHIEEYKTL